MLEHSSDAFVHRADVVVLIVVGRTVEVPGVKSCAGGATRAESVRLGVDVAREMPNPPRFIAIHDAARPGVTQDLIDRVFAAALAHGAAVPGVPVTDTIKRVSGGTIAETLPRDELVAVQTPQAMRLEWYIDALARLPADASVTDDASVLEAAGYPVHVVAGNAANLKVTHPDDLDRLRRHL